MYITPAVITAVPRAPKTFSSSVIVAFYGCYYHCQCPRSFRRHACLVRRHETSKQRSGLEAVAVGSGGNRGVERLACLFKAAREIVAFLKRAGNNKKTIR